MGRGRQKAKHTKVARELKYFSPATDYSALERELTAASHHDDDELSIQPAQPLRPVLNKVSHVRKKTASSPLKRVWLPSPEPSVEPPEVILRPTTRLAYWTGIRLCPSWT